MDRAKDLTTSYRFRYFKSMFKGSMQEVKMRLVGQLNISLKHNIQKASSLITRRERLMMMYSHSRVKLLYLFRVNRIDST